MSIIEMRVHMDCAGCESNIRKALQKLDGVDDVDIDMNMQKVTVLGWADREKVLKTVKKTGRSAELWAYPYRPEDNYNYTQYYYHQHRHHQSQQMTYNYASQPPPYSYNSYQHSYSGDQDYGYGYGYYQLQQPPNYYSTSTMFDHEQAEVMFSDDNPHACSIM